MATTSTRKSPRSREGEVDGQGVDSSHAARVDDHYFGLDHCPEGSRELLDYSAIEEAGRTCPGSARTRRWRGLRSRRR